MAESPDNDHYPATKIDDMLVVTIRIRVAAVPTFHKREANGGGYTLDNMLAREVCEQEMEINLGADEDLIDVLGEMMEATQAERLYGWMAQFRAGLALDADEIAPESEAHLYPSPDLSAISSAQQAASRADRGNPRRAGGDLRQGRAPDGGASSAKVRDVARKADRRLSRSPAELEATPQAKARSGKTQAGGA